MKSHGLSLKVDRAEAERRIHAHEYWYHTIDVADGLVTPGEFDLRHALALMPWPDVTGKRCLDIGTYDGFFAFELERRGAAEVLAVDIEDHEGWDWPAEVRHGFTETSQWEVFGGPPKGAGFRLLAEILGSRVEWRSLSIYDLAPARVGLFDVVVCGSLLLHLRDPISALEAARTVCDGWLLSSEAIELGLLLAPRRPVFRFDGRSETCQWWVPSAAGHERLLLSSGFSIEARSPFYLLRAPAYPRPRINLRSVRWVAREQLLRLLTGDTGPGGLHRALLARARS